MEAYLAHSRQVCFFVFVFGIFLNVLLTGIACFHINFRYKEEVNMRVDKEKYTKTVELESG
ncbi:hypothetical protein C4B60_03380 [Jeotgalibacillus proteolyticus]|uniref:Uncharacterized protein n=1 Tax=Jeotgalibacillus proteolyticus TaxID=2082395 RepID=A0A2S5GHP4_9BACL|nr:hypothetical protein C4B60_03380 [Jeotgalibacillus proteolyticus]